MTTPSSICSRPWAGSALVHRYQMFRYYGIYFVRGLVVHGRSTCMYTHHGPLHCYGNSHPNWRRCLSTKSSTTATATVVPKEDGSRKKKIPNRPWLNSSSSSTNTTWDTRVLKFVDSTLIGELNPHATAFDALMLIDECCRQGTVHGMKLAHQVLDRCLAEKDFRDSEKEKNGNDDESDDTNNTCTPYVVPVKLFQTIVYGWACLARHPSKTSLAMTRMRQTVDQLLAMLQQERQRFGSDTVRQAPTTSGLYNTYLQGLQFASSSSPDAAALAQDVLDEMTRAHVQFKWHTKPNTRSFTLAISAIVHSPFDAKNAGKKAERLLRQLQTVHRHESKLYRQQYGVPYLARNPKRYIPTPDVVVYQLVISAYGKDPSQRAADKSRELLQEAKDFPLRVVDWGLVTSVIAAHANLAANPKVSKQVRYRAAQQAEQVLQMALQDMAKLLEEEQEEDDDSDDQDDDKELGRSKKKKAMTAASRVAPFNACMNAYGRSGSPNGAIQAESMLQKLLTDHVDGTGVVVPDVISFNTVLQAWSRQHTPDAPQKAQDLLQLQHQLVANDPILRDMAMPDMASYSIVMNAWARSGTEPQKVQKTRALLDEMLAGVLEHGTVARGKSNPTVAFSAVLNAAAHPIKKNKRQSTTAQQPSVDPLGGGSTDNDENADNDDDDDSYGIALQTYRELKDDVYGLGCRPDHVAFASMLHAVAAHTHPTSAERRQMVQVVFDDACQAGHVSKLVLKALYKACPDADLLEELLPEVGRPQSVDELPKEWTRNVPQHEYRSMGRPKRTKRIKAPRTG